MYGAGAAGFFKPVECETLYPVGDIIDGWQLRHRGYWPRAHNGVVQTILRKARKGTRLSCVPGNQDGSLRRKVERTFGGVERVADAVHSTATVQRLWINHGDLFDVVVQHAKWRTYLGASVYGVTLKLNPWLNNMTARRSMPYWHLSSHLKLKVKRAVNCVSYFAVAVAVAVARETRKCGSNLPAASWPLQTGRHSVNCWPTRRGLRQLQMRGNPAVQQRRPPPWPA